MNLSTLEHYVEQTNSWNKLFGNYRPLSLLNAEDRQTIAWELEMKLSPENLTCDGELRGRALQERAGYLHRCVAELQSIDPTLVVDF